MLIYTSLFVQAGAMSYNVIILYMCFSQNASLGMAILGAISTIPIYKYINYKAAFCAFYFTLMQVIHYYGYTVIDDCNNETNKLMSILNFYHIAFQAPVFLFGWLGVFEKFNVVSPLHLKFMPIIIIMALITSVLIALRRFEWRYFTIGEKNKNSSTKIIEKSKLNDKTDGTLQGKLCSRSGKHHITFRLPLRNQPEYYTPNLYGHFLFFFIPLLLFNNTTRIISLFTFVFGIVIPTLYLQLESSEVATVWCFLSIIQIIIMYGYFILNKS